MQPGVITFRPTNILTIGIIVMGAYLAAVLAAQAAIRAGLISVPAVSTAPAGGPAAIV